MHACACTHADGLAYVHSQWDLRAGSHGAVSCLGLLSTPPAVSARLEEEVVLTLAGGPWRFSHSEILSVPVRNGRWGGVALRALGFADGLFRTCSLGGSSRRRRSAEAVITEDYAEVCVPEWTGRSFSLNVPAPMRSLFFPSIRPAWLLATPGTTCLCLILKWQVVCDMLVCRFGLEFQFCPVICSCITHKR